MKSINKKKSSKILISAAIAVLAMYPQKASAGDVSTYSALQTAIQSATASTINVTTDISGSGALGTLGATGTVIEGNSHNITATSSSTGITVNSKTLTIQNVGDVSAGYSTTNKGFNGFKNSNGGLVYLSGTSNLTVTNSILSNNNASTSGGAIYANGSSNLTITDSIIYGNTSSNDGAGICWDSTGTETITNTKFINNISSKRTGGIRITTGTTDIKKSYFENNQGTIGGAIGTPDKALKVNIEDSTFYNNQATGSKGGAISVGVGVNTIITIKNSEFKENKSKTEGGAIFNSGLLTIYNSTFTGNTSGTTGGAIYNNGKILNLISDTADTTFTNNTGNGVSNAIYNYSSGGSNSGIINLNAGSHNIIFNDAISGNTGTININQTGTGTSGNYIPTDAPTTGIIEFNNTVDNNTVNLYNGTIKFGTYTNATTPALSGVGNFDSSTVAFYAYGGTIDLVNGTTATTSLGQKVTLNGDVNLSLDLDLSRGTGDEITAGTLGSTSSHIIINAIKLITEADSASIRISDDILKSAVKLVTDTYTITSTTTGKTYTFKYDNTTGYLSVSAEKNLYSAVKNINPTCADGGTRTYTLTGDESVTKSLEDMLGTNTTLIVDGQNKTIKATEPSINGINVKSGQTLKVNNVSDYKGFKSQNGGAINVESGAKLTIDSSIFEGNTAKTNGGAIYAGDDITIINSKFLNSSIAGNGVNTAGGVQNDIYIADGKTVTFQADLGKGSSIQNGLAGNGNFVKTGTGFIDLRGVNKDFKGALTINGTNNGGIKYTQTTDGSFVGGPVSVAANNLLYIWNSADDNINNLSGAGTVYQTGINGTAGNLKISGDNSGFTGTLNIGNKTTQGLASFDATVSGNKFVADTATVNVAGTGSVLTYTLNDSTLPSNINLSNGGQLTVAGSGDVQVNSVEFSGTSVSNLALTGGAKYTINNDLGKANISVDGSTIKFNGDRTLSANVSTSNSTIDLINNTINNINISNLSAGNETTKLALDLVLDDTTTSNIDTITLGEASGTIDVTGLNIIDDNGKNLDKTFTVLNGGSASLSDAGSIILQGNNVYDYTVVVTGSTVEMKATNVANADSLYKMNNHFYVRGFNVLKSSTYNIGRSLGETAKGEFTVSDTNKATTTISGNLQNITIKDNDSRMVVSGSTYTYDGVNVTGYVTHDTTKGTYTIDYNAFLTDAERTAGISKGSFFKISDTNEGVELHLKDVSFADAYRDGTGSVISMDNANSTLDIDSVDFKNNSSTGNGGALYLNNAQSTIDIVDADFSGNSSTNGLGGAIYSNVDLDITDSSFSGNTANGTKNDIYLNGKTIDFTTNDDTSSAISSGIQGTGTLNKLGTGTLNASGINSGFTGAVDIQNGTLTYKATDNGDSFFGGGVNLYDGTTLNIDNDLTNLIANGLTSQTTGAGTINKSGSKILTLNGKNAGYTGQFNINGGSVNYQATSSTDSFLGGNIKFASGTTTDYQSLTIDAGGYDQNVSGNLVSADNTAQFIINDSKGKTSKVTLLGDNSKFTGTTDIQSGILAITQSGTTKYTTGSTIIEDNGELDYASNTNEALTVSGTGKIVKGGTGTTTLSDTDFSGTANINGGILSITPTSQKTAGEFNITGNIAGGTELDYTSLDKTNSYTLDNASTISFNTTNSNATLKLNKGSYNLNSDITNATGNNIIFNNALVNLKNEANYTGKYTFNGDSAINMWDNSTSKATFSNLKIGDDSTDFVSLGVDVDLTYIDGSKPPTADCITITNGSGIIKLTAIGIIADNGIFADSTHTKQVQVINNSAVSNVRLADSENFKLASWSTNIYEYDITAARSSDINSEAEGQSTYDSIKFVADKVADSDSLYKMNKTSKVRGFSMVKDGAENTYYIGRSLSDTASGNFTVSDTKADDTIISGNLHDIVIKDTDSRMVVSGSTYTYDGVDVTSYVSHDTTKGTYTIDYKAFLTDAERTAGISKGSFFRIVKDSTYFTLKNVTIKDAYSAGNGSIIYADADSDITITSAALKSGTATNGGAIYNNYINQLQIDSSTLSDNTATKNGGALYNNTAYGTIYIGSEGYDTTANTFTSNKAKNGGAIYNTDVGGIGSYKTTFNGNNATENGGALYNIGSYISTSDTFNNNTAVDGSAIYNKGTVTLTNPIFTNNNGTSYIYNDTGATLNLYADNDLTINNNTTANITNNGNFNLHETSSSNALTIKDAITGTSGTINTDGTVNLTNSVENQTINVNSGTLSLGDSTSTSALSNLTNDKLTVNSNTTANIYNTSYTTGSITDKGTLNLNNNVGISTNITANIEGTSDSTLNKEGEGTVTIAGDDSNYLGQTNVNQGTLTYSATSATDKFFGGGVNLYDGTTLNIDNDLTNLIANGLTSTDTTAIINKSGSKTLTLNGKNAGYTGQFNINGGEVDYNATNSTDTTFLGGGVYLANGTTLKIDPNGVKANQTVNNLTSGTSSTAQFIIHDTSSSYDGIVTLEGNNKTFTGTTDIQSGILAYTSGTGNAYVGGTTKIGDNGTLKYTNNTNDTISSITGTGILDKEESGNLTISSLPKTFTGTTNVNGGTLTVKPSGQNTSGDFNFNINMAAETKLAYTGKFNDVYNLDSASKLKFNAENSNASANFKTGTYNLLNDVTNGIGNTLSFQGTTVNIKNTNFSGNYESISSKLNFKDDAIKTYTFNQLFTTKSSPSRIQIDVNLDGTSDKIISKTANTGKAFSEGLNKLADEINISGTDYGDKVTRTYNVLTNLSFTTYTFSDKYDSRIYKYTVSTSGSDLILTAAELSTNSLYTLNHNDVYSGKDRTFNFIGTDTNYYIGQKLDTTQSGKLTIQGRATTDTIIAKANSSATTGLSMFDVSNTGTELDIDKITITDANSTTNGAIINATATDSKINVTNSTLTNSNATNGGAIYNAGVLTSSNNTYSNNTATSGSAIYNTGTATLTNDTFTNNNGTSYIYNDTGATLNLYADNDLTINNNTTANITNNGNFNLHETSSSNALTIKDAITGTSGTINTSGTVNLTNSVENQTINVNSGILSLGDSTSISALSNLTNDKLTVNSSTTANIYNTNYATGSIENNGTLNLNNNNDVSTTVSLNIIGSATSKINKTGLGTVTLTGDNTGYNGTAIVNGGTLNVISSTANATKLDFANEITTGTLNYTAGTGSNIDLNNTTTAKFTNTGAGATAQFNSGTYSLTNELSNSQGNNIIFSGDTVKLATGTYANGNYTVKDSVIDLNNNSIGTTTITNLTTNNTGLKIDLDFETPANSTLTSPIPTADILATTGTGGTIALTALNFINESDHGIGSPYSVKALDGNLTFNSSSVTSWASAVYNYTVSVSGQNIILTAISAATADSLKKENQTEGIRGFSLTGADSIPYVIANNLGTTSAGTFTVNGKDNTKDSTISGDNNYSMFDVTNNTDLRLNNLTIKNAKGTTGSVVNVNNANAIVTLNNVDLTSNNSTGDGGAINNTSSNSFAIADANITGNTSGGLGGAIYTADNMTITDSTFSNNTDKNGSNDIYIDTGANVTFQTTNGKTSSISSGLAGNGSLTKTGDGTLDLSGNNSNLTGTLNINGGTVDYTQSSGGSFVGGNVSVADGTALHINNANTDNIKNVSGTGTISKLGDGVLNLNGQNSGFTGITSISEGTLQYNATANTDSFVGGSVTDNSVLVMNIATGVTNQSLSNLSGSGKLEKTGDGSLDFNNYNIGSEFNALVNGGTLNVISSTANATKLDFANEITTGTLNYTAGTGSNIDLNNTTTAKFTNTGAGATAQFNSGTYSLTNELSNSQGNNIIFSGDTVKLATGTYANGNYTVKDSVIDLNNSSIGTTTITNLTTNNAGLKIDLDFETPANSTLTSPVPTADILATTGTGGTIALTALNFINESDHGIGSPYSVKALDGNLTFNSSSVTSWASAVYNYTVSVSGQNIILTATSAVDSDSLKKENQTEGIRGFSLTGADSIPYVIANNLGTTSAGTFTVNGKDNTKYSTISGDNNYSMFDVTNNTDLRLNNLTIKNAKGTTGSVVNVNNANAIVTLNNVDLTSNNSTGDGGAINNTSSNSFAIADANITGNTSGGLGGAIYTADNMKITDSSFSNNTDKNGANDIYIDGTNTNVEFNTTTGKTSSISSGLAGNGTLTKTGDGTLDLTGNNKNLTGALNINNGTVDYTQSAGGSFVGGPVAVADGTALHINNANTDNIQNVSGSGAISKTGDGTLNLTGQNAGFGGDLNITTGKVAFNQTNSGDTYIQGATNVGGSLDLNVDKSDTQIGVLKGAGTVTKTGSKDVILTGDDSNYTGTLDVNNGNVQYNSNGTNKYLGSTSTTNLGVNGGLKVNTTVDTTLTNTVTGTGTITKTGASTLTLTNSQSGFNGNLGVREGKLTTEANSTLGNLNTVNVSGTGSFTTGEKSTIGTVSNITISDSGNFSTGKNSTVGTVGNLTVNSGTFGIGLGTKIGTITNGIFAGGTTFNLHNTSAVKDSSGNWTTDPNPASIENLNFTNLTLNGNVNYRLDADLKNSNAETNSDRISATNVSGTGKFVIDNASLSVVSDSLLDNTQSHILGGALATGNYLDLQATSVMGPIQKYNLSYSNGYLNFAKQGGDNPDYNSVNPAVMAAPIATQMGGYFNQVQTLNDAFYHMDRYTKYPYRLKAENNMRNRSASLVCGVYRDAELPEDSEAFWIKPYTTFETVSLKNGPKVDNMSYGALYGGDSELKDLGHGFYGVISPFIGYNGSHYSYDSVSANMEGGTLGVTGTLYKGNFFTGLAVSAGGSAGEAYTHYGTDNFAMITAGVASKSGYNFEIKQGKLIVQPSLFMAYSFVNTFDYTNAAGVRIDAKPLNAIQVAPGLKVIANTRKGWQPYFGVNMVWNILDKAEYKANDVSLPQLSVKPYVEYGVGLQKSLGERFTGFLQAMMRGGGRNGVALSFGFRWAVGKKPNNENINSVSSKRTILKQMPKNK